MDKLISEKEIQQKVKELGQRISQDYEDKDLLLVIVLRGSYMLAADLSRQITVPHQVDFLAVESYNDTESTGTVKFLKDLEEPITDRNVLIVEDIVDTGRTLNYLLNTLRLRKPESLEVCSLLDKPSRRVVEIEPMYKGFEIPDKFVVGYGMDRNQWDRHWPFIKVVKGG